MSVLFILKYMVCERKNIKVRKSNNNTCKIIV